MYLPLDAGGKGRRRESVPDRYSAEPGYREVGDVALELSRLLSQAGAPAIADELILRGLLATAAPPDAITPGPKPNSVDFIQSENDFIDAYNALTRSTPLPSVDDRPDGAQAVPENNPKRDMYDVIENASQANNINSTTTSKNTINMQQTTHTPEILMDLNNTQINVTQDKQFQAIPNINGHSQQEEPPIPSPSRQSLSPEKVEITTVTVTLPIDKSNSPAPEKLQRNENIEQNPAENIQETLPSLPASKSSNKNISKNADNSETDPNVNEGAEKTSNLNDIVGNTQRLIQQMKDEINSDINYIDSRNTSQSEADSSSNESDISSEHESSYSDTEDKETDNLSSNEDETSSTESETEHMSERRPTIIHRTSSEENDQFEEAMDHIEDQMEDFKNTNIEILDSIARSLQEEHTLSVEVNESETINDEGDLNNNLFIEVNSFEEIYAELNNNKGKNYKSSNQVSKNKTNRIETPKKGGIVRINATKEPIIINHYEKVDPIRLIISENNLNTLNAVIEDIEEDILDLSEKKLLNNTEEGTKQDIQLVNGQNHEVSNSSDEGDLYNSTDSEVTPTSQNILISNANKTFTENTAIQKTVIENGIIEVNITNSNITDEILEANSSTVQLMAMEDIIEQVIAMEQNIAAENSASNALEDVTETMSITDVTIENSSENHTPTENIIEPHNMSDINTNTNENGTGDNIATENMAEPMMDEEIELTNDPIPDKDSNHESNEHTETSENDLPNNANNDSQTIKRLSEERKSLSKSPPKTSDGNTNKAFITNKSNIPKLVKVVQSNKQKGDKTSPKVAVSKVPVRRASVKQYPAPTPPKAHFGNVQSGHVKQLQTRLFNNKFPKTVVNVPDVVNVKPSTSTMHKKKPAPPPPTSEQKRPSPTKVSPPKEKKKNFFRESCRTEDEWTESDAEDAPPPTPREAEQPPRAPSPPPPVTVRRVSGQIIDLARVRLPEGSPERQARMLLAEGATETWEQARLAVELVARGAEAAAALLAALECADLAAALAYLHQDCELCAARLPEHEMVSMLRCTHRCCRECARLYFTVQITERSIADCVCPFCKEPDLENMPEDAWMEYFAHLDILLKTLLETDVHELFQRKLRDRTLARDPNFRWCMECSSGFFVHPKQKKIRCPECRSVSCAKCRKAWSVNHEGLSCEQYAAWLDDNDPERSLAAVHQHLRENGLECPRCRFKYSLSRGGCMHFTCTQCKFEFCYGCGKPFMMGARCGLSEYCARLGLHAHHPRNCLFYLRDKEPHELQTLLQMNNVTYETQAPEGSSNRCPIQLQRETPTGLVDGICGSDTPANFAGLCQLHYVEYLAAKARALDPIPIMDVSELVAELRRRALPLPERGPWDTDPVYAGMCAEIVREKIPLD